MAFTPLFLATPAMASDPGLNFFARSENGGTEQIAPSFNPSEYSYSGVDTNVIFYGQDKAYSSLGVGDSYTFLWNGYITPTRTGLMTFISYSDDGFILNLNGTQVIYSWYDQGGGQGFAGTYEMIAGQSYYFEVAFHENGGGEMINLLWDDLATNEFVPVPDSAFTRTSIPVVEPTPEPTPEPTIEPTPEPTQEPVPVDPIPVEPAPEVSPVAPQPPVEPTPIEPIPEPTVEPEQPAPVEPEPIKPEPEVTEIPEPSPEPSPEPTKETVIEEEVVIEPKAEPEVKLEDMLEIDPEDLTDAQVEQLVENAEQVLATAEPGSEIYEQALDALAIAAESDDAELPAELAAIPLLGDVAGAALELFNDLGNLGADMAPETRERAEETIVAAVIVGQVAQVATSAAVASAGATSAGSSGRRIK